MDLRMDLPNVPELKGEGDLEMWKTRLKGYLRVFGLEKYIKEEVPQPQGDEKALENWHRERAIVELLITSSIEPVQQTLLNFGLDPKEQDPKKIYDTILKAVPKVSEEAVGRLMAEFCQIKRVKFFSMEAYRTRIQYLKTRLAQLGCEQTDKAMIWVTINGLEEYDQKLCRWLQRDMQKGDLTWDKLMAELALY